MLNSPTTNQTSFSLHALLLNQLLLTLTLSSKLKLRELMDSDSQTALELPRMLNSPTTNPTSFSLPALLHNQLQLTLTLLLSEKLINEINSGYLIVRNITIIMFKVNSYYLSHKYIIRLLAKLTKINFIFLYFLSNIHYPVCNPNFS